MRLGWISSLWIVLSQLLPIKHGCAATESRTHAICFASLHRCWGSTSLFVVLGYVPLPSGTHSPEYVFVAGGMCHGSGFR